MVMFCFISAKAKRGRTPHAVNMTISSQCHTQSNHRRDNDGEPGRCAATLHKRLGDPAIIRITMETSQRGA